MRSSRTRDLARAGVVAAVYGGLSIAVLQFMPYLSWGPIQLRLSEALTVLPLFWSGAVPGLWAGTLLANLFNLGAAGPLGWLDVVFGSLATLLAAMYTRRFRSRPALALAGPVVINALVVAAYLPAMLSAAGVPLDAVYRIPFVNVALTGGSPTMYAAMYAFGVVTIGLGQAAVVYGLGLPLAAALRRSGALGDTE